MAYPATVYNVMIASPNDVQEERDAVRESVARWNAIHSKDQSIVLLPVGWETQSSPEMGDHPQNILNRQILEPSDLLVGLFWTRVGTPTDHYVSGSVEEIRRHVDAGKPAMLYFSNRPVRLDNVDEEQRKELQGFKDWCSQNGLLGECEDLPDFREKFYDHLQLKLNSHPYFQNTAVPEIQPSPSDLESSLSNQARNLLVVFAEGDGKVRHKVKSLEEIIEGGGKRLVDSEAIRGFLLCKEAIEELQQKEIIEDISYRESTGMMSNRTDIIYRITARGFHVYDRMMLLLAL